MNSDRPKFPDFSSNPGEVETTRVFQCPNPLPSRKGPTKEPSATRLREAKDLVKSCCLKRSGIVHFPRVGKVDNSAKYLSSRRGKKDHSAKISIFSSRKVGNSAKYLIFSS